MCVYVCASVCEQRNQCAQVHVHVAGHFSHVFCWKTSSLVHTFASAFTHSRELATLPPTLAPPSTVLPFPGTRPVFADTCACMHACSSHCPQHKNTWAASPFRRSEVTVDGHVGFEWVEAANVLASKTLYKCMIAHPSFLPAKSHPR
jgi:hypothetical protein